MKLKEIINLFDENGWCYLTMEISGIEFKSRTRFGNIKKDDDILNKEVKTIQVYAADICIILIN